MRPTVRIRGRSSLSPRQKLGLISRVNNLPSQQIVERFNVIVLSNGALQRDRGHRADERRQIALDVAQQIGTRSRTLWYGSLDLRSDDRSVRDGRSTEGRLVGANRKSFDDC